MLGREGGDPGLGKRLNCAGRPGWSPAGISSPTHTHKLHTSFTWSGVVVSQLSFQSRGRCGEIPGSERIVSDTGIEDLEEDRAAGREARLRAACRLRRKV